MDEKIGQPLVLFGASGDLTQRKLLPALFRLNQAGKLPPGFRLVGYARSELDDASFRDLAAAALKESASGTEEEHAGFLARVRYVRGGYDDDEGLTRLRDALGDSAAAPPIYYLALPPQTTEAVLQGMAAGKLPTAGARILMEKPFGVDLDSARRLNRLLVGCLPESNIHRIDHYLAKDTVRNLLFFRFANTIFEPIWNRHYIAHIQVSATETIGVENRGGYYDGIGVVRDMLQNHVLLLLAFAAMEPPLADDAESIRDRINDVLRSIDPPGRRDFVFGQYDGYRDAKGVDAKSNTPTFAAVRLYIRNWRWHEVPVYLMSGKCLSSRVSEVTFVFRHLPLCLVGSDSCSAIPPNVLTLRIHPSEGIRLSLGVKRPGYRDEILPAALDFRYSDLANAEGEKGRLLFSGYERVLLEALAGTPGLSWRADAIESAWRIVGPALSEDPRGGAPMIFHQPGAHGADLAAGLLRNDNRQWYDAGF